MGYLAREHLWELDDNEQPSRLVAAPGDVLSEEDFRVLGLAKNSPKLLKVKDDDPEALQAAWVELGLQPDLDAEE